MKEIYFDEIHENINNFTKSASGWQLVNVIKLMLHIVTYKPLSGSSYIKLSKAIESKRAIINIKNTENQCFKWAVTKALNIIKDEEHPDRLTKKLREQAEKYNWEDLTFPVNLHDIKKFEKNNVDISVNVFGVDINNIIHPLRIYEGEDRKCKVNLLLYQQHYCVIKEINRLIRSQISQNHKKDFIVSDVLIVSQVRNHCIIMKNIVRKINQ